MNKIAKAALALLVLIAVSLVVYAGTTTMGLGVNLTQVGNAAIALGQTTMSASLPVAFASNQSALAVTGTFWQATQPVSGTFWQATQPVSGTFWQTTQAVSLPAVSAPTIAKVGATTSSAQLIASNATRKGIEIDTDCANTDGVAINFGASAAVYASHKQLAGCVNWQPPPGVVVTSAIQVISNTGTQQVRVIEYP